MAIKQDLKQIQEEFKSDEKLLEGAFKLERFYKQYKYVLWAILAFLLLWFGYTKFLDMQKESRIKKITAIYNEVLQNPQNVAVLARLKTIAPKLHDLYLYAKALKNQDEKTLESLKHSTSPLVQTLASYYYASYTQDLKTLQSLNLPGLSDFITLQKAYLLQNKPNAAKQIQQILATIPPTSNLYQIATLMRHYPATGKQPTKGHP
ncbi:hypothetical protein [Helicobacter suis]|uniref:hypothetical protein n=1 Tax=Helicobacter suis TaxID=104628 RepID=UPI0013D7A027|nr:hypothetical protein [Helicobacter suis]